MKKLVLIAALLSATIASAQASTSIYQSDQTASGGAVPSANSDGIALSGVTGWSIYVCPKTAGATLSGATSIEVFAYDDALTVPWAYVPELARSVTQVTTATNPCIFFADVPVSVSIGKAYVRVVTSTPSSGTNVLVYVRTYSRIR